MCKDFLCNVPHHYDMAVFDGVHFILQKYKTLDHSAKFHSRTFNWVFNWVQLLKTVK